MIKNAIISGTFRQEDILLETAVVLNELEQMQL